MLAQHEWVLIVTRRASQLFALRLTLLALQAPLATAFGWRRRDPTRIDTQRIFQYAKHALFGGTTIVGLRAALTRPHPDHVINDARA